MVVVLPSAQNLEFFQLALWVIARCWIQCSWVISVVFNLQISHFHFDHIVVKHRAVVYSCLVKDHCEDRVGVVVRVDANKAELLKPGLYFDQALGMCLAVHDKVLLILLFMYLWDRDSLIEQVVLVAQELQVLHLCLDNLGLEFVIAYKPQNPVKSSWFPVAIHFTDI